MAKLNRLPRSWADLESCDCGDCRAMVEIRDECEKRGEFMFVLDARPYGKGFRICDDVRVLYERAAAGEQEFESAEHAAAAVLQRQSHCDAYMSTFPLAARCLTWRRVSYEHPEQDGQRLTGVLLRIERSGP